MAGPFLTITLPDEAATAAFAEDVAAILLPGDVIALSGGLGAGKTTFARALIRAVAGDPSLEVPSPTFTLVQTYGPARLSVAHFDLYRLAAADELDEIGFADAAVEGAVLVEWPERAEARLPAERLDIRFEIDGSGRRAEISAGGTWPTRIARTRLTRTLIDRAGWNQASRHPIQGDASTRRYERVDRADRSAVLMDWPRPAAPPVRDSRAAYRAQDVRAFVAVDNALRAAGLSAPEILAADLDAGLLLMEDFGNVGVVTDGLPNAERYAVAVDLLAAIHAEPRDGVLPSPDGGTHSLLRLSGEVLAADITLFTDWYVPRVAGGPLDAHATEAFAAIWATLFARLRNAEQSWVLFDMQSPNLFWLEDRRGIGRIGLIDFQDMFIGPAAYDVASLCQDARVTIPQHLETVLCDRYVARRRESTPTFDPGAFSEAYAILGTARALKNLGVFARQADYAGNTSYLRHLPRVGAYLRRNLRHPVLSDLAVWYERHLPAPSQAAE